MAAFNKLIIYTDGGARGNPGPAAIGVVICDQQGRIIKKYSEFSGKKTNNEAEYEAIIAALKLARDLGASEVRVNLDSELATRQLNGIYRVRQAHLQKLLIAVRNLEMVFKKVSYRSIPREKNMAADKLVNECLDREARHRPDK